MKSFFRLSDDLELVPHDEATQKYILNRKAGDVLVGDIKIFKDDKRTLTQNGCLHEFIADLSSELNGAGFDVKQVITVSVDFTPETVKKYMVHPIMKALFPDIESTADLSTKQISEVYENLNRLTAEKFGISCAWPSRLNK